MIISIYCKASTQIGLGHLIRSFSFANQILLFDKDISVNFYLIGDVSLSKLITNKSINVKAVPSESDFVEIIETDILVLDMTDISLNLLNKLKATSKVSAILSPVFNYYNHIDLYFGRTKYLNFDIEQFPNLKIFAGFEYAIIQDNCKKISAGTFEQNLNSTYFPIAIIMGGGDATNKTLELLRGLKHCTVSATFWVMLGEGYKHSLDDLIDEIRRDTNHEIILAKTNSSMWSILQNCVLCILPGGVTSFEAVYAGLPSINFFENKSQEFLLREIAEHKAAYNFGEYNLELITEISKLIEELFKNRKKLLQMHVNSKNLIDNRGSQRILETIKKEIL